MRDFPIFRYGLILQFFENLIDPFEDIPLEAHPAATVWEFLKTQCQPFKKVLAIMFVFALCSSLVEVLFLVGIGRFIDWVQSSPDLLQDNLFLMIGGLGLF